MSLLVQKFGGTSVGTPERIRAVARRVAAAHRAGNQLVVVVSAMADTTDDLLALAAAVTGRAHPGEAHSREVDMLLTSGERISMALLAMAIREAGAEAVSFTGSQAAILTDGTHTAARIREIRAERVREALAEGCVAIVAGFQGVSPDREVTTLGRGGSDTSAVALAAALGADRCEIFTDVEGVYTADPRRVPDARLIRELSHAEMLELASAGAQVMHPRAVEIGDRFGVDIRVLSSFSEDADPNVPRGTLITQTPHRMEEFVLTGIATSTGQARLGFRDLPAGLATVTEVLSRLADAGISVDMVSQHGGVGEPLHLQLSIVSEALPRARPLCEAMVGELGASGLEVLDGLTRVALVGSGMHGRPGVYARAFQALLEANAEVRAISTSAISITLLVPSEREQAALRALHRAFALELGRG